MKVKDLRQLLKGVRGDVELHVFVSQGCVLSDITTIVLRDSDGNCAASVGKAKHAVIHTKPRIEQ